jgi:chloride channel 2
MLLFIHTPMHPPPSHLLSAGIVDMKVILSGHSPQGSPVLALHLIPTKILGLMLALASGLSVGKEGPLVQVTAAFATLLLKSFGDLFDGVRDSESKRLDILACACAAGISATFGAAYGGVLYSIEVLCINSSSNNIPRAYLCCICSMLVYFWLGADSHVSLYMRAKKEVVLTNQENVHDENKVFQADEILLCMMLGILCGVVGSIFVTLLHFVFAARNFLFRASLPKSTVVRRQYAMVCMVALLISPLM